MAVCEDCGFDMLDPLHAGCTVTARDLDGERGLIVSRVPYGEERRYVEPPDVNGLPPDEAERHLSEWRAIVDHLGPWPSEERCSDCGVLVGNQHHPGCDTEECIRCRHQAITCDCHPEDGRVPPFRLTARVVSNFLRLNDPDEGLRIVTRYRRPPGLVVTLEHGFFTLLGDVWPEMMKASRPENEDSPKLSEADFEAFLLELAPLVMEPLCVQAMGHHGALWPLKAKQWVVQPGATSLQVTAFSTRATFERPE